MRKTRVCHGLLGYMYVVNTSFNRNIIACFFQLTCVLQTWKSIVNQLLGYSYCHANQEIVLGTGIRWFKADLCDYFRFNEQRNVVIDDSKIMSIVRAAVCESRETCTEIAKVERKISFILVHKLRSWCVSHVAFQAISGDVCQGLQTHIACSGIGDPGHTSLSGHSLPLVYILYKIKIAINARLLHQYISSVKARINNFNCVCLVN